MQEQIMAAANVVEITDANFETEVGQSELPVLVDFWATWCGPCMMISPTIDALATEFAGKVKVGKVNIDQNRQLPVKFRVNGIPTLMVFKGGQVVDTVVGAQNKDRLTALLNKHTA
jgi:thioredoxin 1